MDFANVLDLEREKNELIDGACQMIDDYVETNTHEYQKPDFHTRLDEAVFEMLSIQFENVYDEEIEEILYGVIAVANRIYFTNILPRRSYKTTFVKDQSSEKKKQLAEQIEYLRNLPQPEQRTNEWYLYRQNLLTASNAWKGLSSQSHKNSLIYEKCKPIDTTKYDRVNMDSPFHWGTKYEELSVIIYEDKYGTKVEDFGCIQDKNFKFLGASPDGINVDPRSKRYGRMLEIKNRFSDSVPITGNPKLEYWIQMQLQMNVCELNECDFLETRFMEYDDKEAFNADGTFTHTADGKRKGIYFCMLTKDNKPVYFYPPLSVLETQESYDAWEEKTLEENQDKMWFTSYYWKLEKMSCVLVLRNELWFDYATTELKEVWETIEKERVTGYEHRAPNKRKGNEEKPSTSSSSIFTNALFNVIKIDTEPQNNEKTDNSEKTIKNEKTDNSEKTIKNEKTDNSEKTIKKEKKVKIGNCLLNIESLLKH
jgi:putative phage-type endonuclease